MIGATLDVNILVSASIGPLGASRQIVAAWQAGRFAHATSEHIIQQALLKLALPRIRRYTQPDLTARLLETLLRTQATLVPIPPAAVIAVTEDPEDDTVLATVRLSQVEYLVTGDHGLLDLGSYAGARIVTPQQFLAVLGQPPQRS